MAHTVTWDASYEALPDDEDWAYTLGDAIRDLKRDIRERMELGFEWEDDDDGGKVKAGIPFLVQAGDPSASGTDGFLYGKALGGYTELYYMNDNSDVAAVLVADGRVPLENDAALQGLDTGSTARDIAQVDSADDCVIGSNDLPTVLKGDASDTGLMYDSGSGQVAVWHNENLKLVESGQYAVPVTTYTWAHGLSTAPIFVSVVLQCITTEYGWAVDDEIYVGGCYFFRSFTYAVDEGWVIGADDTNVYLVGDSGTDDIYIRNRSTGVAVVITPARWKVRIRAFGPV